MWAYIGSRASPRTVPGRRDDELAGVAAWGDVGMFGPADAERHLNFLRVTDSDESVEPSLERCHLRVLLEHLAVGCAREAELREAKVGLGECTSRSDPADLLVRRGGQQFDARALAKPLRSVLSVERVEIRLTHRLVAVAQRPFDDVSLESVDTGLRDAEAVAEGAPLLFVEPPPAPRSFQRCRVVTSIS